MLSKNVETFLECDKTYEEADTVLFGAPFDSTTSFRPEPALEVVRSVMNPSDWRATAPTRTGIFGTPGSWTAVIWNFLLEIRRKCFREIEERAAEILSDGKRPFLLGGEHLVTLGAFRAALKKYPELCMIHFDAHTDLREDYLGVKLSHACVIRRCWELAGEGRIHQFGIRSGEREEFLFGKEHTDLHAFTFDGLAEVLDSLKDTPVYFTVDLDVMDPSVFPGTGTPEPGGVQLR